MEQIITTHPIILCHRDNIGNNTSGNMIRLFNFLMNGFEVNRNLGIMVTKNVCRTSSNNRSSDVGGGNNYTEKVQV